MRTDLDRDRLDQILTAVGDRLDGDWLLIGGALAALWFEPRRTTADIDIVGLQGTSQERFALMTLAQELGLPIEALNSAADFFVYRIPGWRDEIELFRSGARGRIWRPTPTLFLLLKIGRLSEADLQDCLLLVQRAKADGLPVNATRVAQAIAALGPTDEVTAGRRSALLAALGP